MGSYLTRRLMRDGHDFVVYDVSADAIAQLQSEGATVASTLEDFVARLSPPRAAWIMVPAAFAGDTVEQVAALMATDDIVIDGGNTY
jgi:6-phosphogluconate dehydrogenase